MNSEKVSNETIGGQALIEGVMMRGCGRVAIAVRKPDGKIDVELKKSSNLDGHWVKKIPFLRGVVTLVSSMFLGVEALTHSASFYPEEKPSRFELFLKKKLGSRADQLIMGISVVLAFAFAMLLFGVLPTGLVGFMRRFIDSPLLLSASEGLIKVAMFITYILLISRLKDIHRTFQYHGAEHQTIHCYESGQEVTVENARGFTTLHPRCGTSFIFFVLAISIILFTFLSWESLLVRMGIKLILLPFVAGISYEIIRLAGQSTHPVIKVLSYPGLWMQKLTTRQPDDDQLQVAIVAFLAVLQGESYVESLEREEEHASEEELSELSEMA